MEQHALQILNENRTMSIATVRPDGWPQTTIDYANDGWRLYFLIYRTSQKFENISHDNIEPEKPGAGSTRSTSQPNRMACSFI